MSALLVVIFVAAGEASHPSTQGAVSAARELLGPEHEVEVREIDVPDDARALSLGSDLHAGAVVELAWQRPEHRQVLIRLHIEPRAGFSERLLGFSETDELFERGRTVGYAVASILTAPQAAPPAKAAPPPPPLPIPSRAEAPHAFVPLPPSGPGPTTHGHGALDVSVAGATGVNGPAGGWGGSLSGRWYIAAPLAVRVGGSARSGQVTPAQSTSLLLHAALGIAWIPLPAALHRPFELGARLDGLLMREQLTHFDSDDVEPARAARWLPGADLVVEGSWFFSPNAGFLAAFGGEFALGRTDVTIRRETVTTVPPVRLVVQAGVRAAF